jgi:hypothetical protein
VSDLDAPRAEPPRLLHRRLGYTASTQQAMRGEPEAVDEAEQRRQTAIAHRREHARLDAAWRRARPMMLDALDLFRREAGPTVPPAVQTHLRHLTREVDRVDVALRGGSRLD